MSAYAQTYLGDLCWEVAEEGSEGYILKLAVSDVGNNHLTLNGIEISDQGEPRADGEIVHGNAELVGNEVLFSLNATSNSAEEIAAVTYSISISTTSLSGTYEGVATVHDKLEDVTIVGYGSGTFTNLSCP